MSPTLSAVLRLGNDYLYNTGITPTRVYLGQVEYVAARKESTESGLCCMTVSLDKLCGDPQEYLLNLRLYKVTDTQHIFVC